jgi:hypothetical protein
MSYWNGTYVIVGDGKQIAIGAEGGELLIGPSLYTEPIWRLTQEQAESLARLLVHFTWEAARQEATMPP